LSNRAANLDADSSEGVAEAFVCRCGNGRHRGSSLFAAGADTANGRSASMKTDSNPLVFRVNMEAGHGGKSGRFQQYRSRAEYYAFMLGQLGIKN
jgi:hypothetical protein